MYMTINNTHRRGGALHSARGWLFAVLALAALLVAGNAAATSTLNNVDYQALPGGRVQLRLTFAGGQVPSPKIFTTQEPPRIAVDFADTHDAFGKRHLDIEKGSTSGVSVVSAGGRTRVVVELIRQANYHTSTRGHSLLLTVSNGTQPAPAVAAANVDPTKTLPTPAGAPAVTGVEFHRGQDGQGRVLINFSGSGAHVDVSRSSDSDTSDVDLDLSNVDVPQKFAKRLDVVDFATPVTTIETHPKRGAGAHMIVHVNGRVTTSSYQTGKQYVLEVARARKQSEEQKNGIIGKSDKPHYKGKPATFNFQNIPVRSALQLIAQVSNLNIVASDSVSGNVTLHLINVPWDQALDVILRAKGLDKRRSGNIIWVAPQTEIAAYEQNVAEARLKAQDAAQLQSAYIPISYGKAADIAKLLTTGSLQGGGGGGGGSSGGHSRGFLSPRGSVSYDQRTNTLLLHDTPENIEKIRKLVAVLDKPVRQVMIESRIVAASDSFERNLGVQWGVDAFHVTSGGHRYIASDTQQNTSSLNDSLNSVAGGTSNTLTYPGGLNVNLPGPAAGSPAGRIALGILSSSYDVNLELAAAQTEGRTEIISSPKVITANQQEADIQQGEQIGYVTYQNSTGGGAQTGTATVQFKNVVLELKVTPTITADNRVFLKINVKKDALEKFIDNPGGGQVPQISTRSINTSVLIDNGQTVVLGGIHEITKTDSTVKVPGLGDIPILGYLFRSKDRQNNKAELLIFVTPRILSETGR